MYSAYCFIVYLWYIYSMFIVYLWYVYGMFMVCLWYVAGKERIRNEEWGMLNNDKISIMYCIVQKFVIPLQKK